MSKLVKTSELLGAALDWAVAKCEGKEWNLVESFLDYYDEGKMHYANDWAQGGPINDREKISLIEEADGTWQASIGGMTGLDKPFWHENGPTQLIAAMRCYVASKLGDEVEIPQELA